MEPTQDEPDEYDRWNGAEDQFFESIIDALAREGWSPLQRWLHVFGKLYSRRFYAQRTSSTT